MDITMSENGTARTTSTSSSSRRRSKRIQEKNKDNMIIPNAAVQPVPSCNLPSMEPMAKTEKRTRKRNLVASVTTAAAHATQYIPNTPQFRSSSNILSNTSYTSSSGQEDPNKILMDLGKLIKGRLIQRPSASVRSPYVADVLLLPEDVNGNDIGEDHAKNQERVVQAHSPALDVGGLCVPGTIVYLTERPAGGKTSHSIQLLLAPAPHCAHAEEHTGILVGVHPQLGEQLAESALSKGFLKDVIGYGPAQHGKLSNDTSNDKKRKGNTSDDNHQNVNNGPTTPSSHSESQPSLLVLLHRQCTRGDSRVDFELTEQQCYPKDDNNKTRILRRSLVEVKNVVCSDYKADLAPTKSGTNHCVIASHNEPYTRTALFPWGRVGQTFEGRKVVSERAIKHLRNLAMISSSDAASSTTTATTKSPPKEKVNGIVLFVINRSDCDTMRACHEACPMFAEELQSAAEKGCIVTSFRVHWTRDGKAYFDGIIPVTLPT